jgi:hypothetical protein
MIEVIWGLVLSGMGGLFLLAAIFWTRRQSIPARLAGTPFALFFVAFGICHIAKGLGHPLMSKETNGMVFVIGALVCLALALIFGLIARLRSRKLPTTSLHSTPR